MIVEPHPHFIRSYRKRIFFDRKLVRKTEERLELFRSNTKHPLLHDHALTGSLRGYRAFSVAADIRIVYFERDEDVIVLYDIGNHNQVY